MMMPVSMSTSMSTSMSIRMNISMSTSTRMSYSLFCLSPNDEVWLTLRAVDCVCSETLWFYSTPATVHPTHLSLPLGRLMQKLVLVKSWTCRVPFTHSLRLRAKLLKCSAAPPRGDLPHRSFLTGDGKSTSVGWALSRRAFLAEEGVWSLRQSGVLFGLPLHSEFNATSANFRRRLRIMGMCSDGWTLTLSTM